MPKHPEADVESDGDGALRGQPAGALGTAGPDLEDPASDYRTEQAELRLGPALGPPDERAAGPVVAEEAAVLLGVRAGLGVPPRAGRAHAGLRTERAAPDAV